MWRMASGLGTQDVADNRKHTQFCYYPSNRKPREIMEQHCKEQEVSADVTHVTEEATLLSTAAVHESH